MAMHQFKAESKKLLDLMINSIYTNREIFLRELISNASDACDKRYFKSLTDTTIGITKDDLKIHVQPDKDSRTLTISDNGIGMTKEDLEKNLDEVYITVNKNTIPNEPRSPFITSGVRIGTPAVTTRGLKEDDMDKIAGFISDAITDFAGKADAIRAGVCALCEKYPLYE